MYNTVSDYTTYATAVGVTLPTTDADKTIQLVKACRYIDSLEPQLMGYRVDENQDNAYPRYDMIINGYPYSSTTVPSIVKTLELELALDINAGVDIYNRESDLPVVSESVAGAISVTYATPASVYNRKKESMAVSLIRQLSNNAGMSVRLVRT